MPICTTCGGEFNWAYDEDKDRWVLLEPVALHSDLDRTYVDAEGELRADHRDRHQGGKSSPTVHRLQRRVKAEEVPLEQSKSRIAAAASALTRGRG